MSVIIIKRLTFIIALLLAQPCLAGTDLAQQQQALTQLIQLTTLDEQIAQFPGEVRSQLAQLADESNRQRIHRIQAYFNPSLLNQALRRQINLNMLAPRYELLLSRLQTPPLSTLLQMEQQALGVVARYERPIFIKHAQRRPPSKARNELIKALDQSTGHSDTHIRSELLLRQQLQRLIGPKPGDGLAAHALPREQFNDPALRQQMLFSMHYTYRNASDNELQTYLDFYRSHQGQHFIKTFNSAWLAAINDVMRDIAWRLKHS